MKIVRLLIIGASILTAFLWGCALTEAAQFPHVRVAELEVDSSELENFKAAIKDVG